VRRRHARARSSRSSPRDASSPAELFGASKTEALAFAKRAATLCATLAGIVADAGTDARLATSLLCAASEASAFAGDAELSSALAAKASAAAEGADAAARRLANAQARRARAVANDPQIRDALDVSVFDPESEAFVSASRLLSAASALAAGDSRGAELYLREETRERASFVARGGRDDGDGDDGARLARRDARREKRAEGGKGSRQDPRQGDARRGGGRRGGARRNGGVRARRARDGDGG
jgi:hypothetical protein